MSHITAALNELQRSNAPAWVHSVLRQTLDVQPVTIGKGAPKVFEAGSVAQLWAWAATRMPVVVAPHVSGFGGKQPARKCSSVAQLHTALRTAFDYPASDGAVVKSLDGTWGLLASAQGYPEVAQVVPTAGPRGAHVAFVAHSPSPNDAARGEPLTGPEGRVFAEQYLAPLGLAKKDVLVTHLMPLGGSVEAVDQVPYRDWVEGELKSLAPRLVVALGKEAKAHLGSLASICLPHPSALLKSGDWGEVNRKLVRLRKRLDTMLALTGSVHIAKSMTEQQVVYGVVLDGYQFDSQDDWVPPWEIRNTAWNWVANSRVIGFMHERPMLAEVVESYLWPYPTPEDEAAAMRNDPHKAFESTFGSDQVHSGSWVLGTRVAEPEVWQAIKSGELTGYSIGGTGVRVDVDAAAVLPQVTFIKQGV